MQVDFTFPGVLTYVRILLGPQTPLEAVHGSLSRVRSKRKRMGYPQTTLGEKTQVIYGSFHNRDWLVKKGSEKGTLIKLAVPKHFSRSKCLFIFLESATGPSTVSPREEESEAKEISNEESSGSQ